MDYAQIEQAFIKADDLAQKGDQQAFEDAQYFAQILKSRPKKESPGALAQLAGGAAAVGDFVVGSFNQALTGLGGMAKGAYDAATTDKSFLDASADAIRSGQEYLSPTPIAKATGLGQTGGYQRAEEALAMPGAAGTMAIKGWQGLARLPFEGLESTVQKMEDPWRDPLGVVTAEALGPVLGYGLAGKAGAPFKKLAENLDKTQLEKPAPLPSFEPTAPTGPIDYPRNKLGSALKDTEDLTAFYPEGISESNIPLPQGEGLSLWKSGSPDLKIEKTKSRLDQSEELIQLGKEREIRVAADKKAEDMQIDAARRARDRERDVEIQESLRGRKEQQALDRRLEQERSTPVDYGLSLEERPTRGETIEAERDQIYEGRKEFPTMDIDLLPERVAKDSVIKGLITRYNNLHGELRGLYQKAHELGVQGVNVRLGDLKLSKKAKEEITSLQDRISTLEKTLNNLSEQVQRRMSNKHNVDVEGTPLFKGVEEKGVTKEGKIEYTEGKYAQEPPSVKGPAERTTGLQVEKTNAPILQRSSEVPESIGPIAKTERFPTEARTPIGSEPNVLKTETPTMERDPNVKVEGTNVVQKSKSHPLGGVGKKQGGAVDLTTFWDGIRKLAEGTKVLLKDGRRGEVVGNRLIRILPKDMSETPWQKLHDQLHNQAFQGYVNGQHTFDQAMQIFDGLLEKNKEKLQNLYQQSKTQQQFIPKVLVEGEKRPRSLFESDIEQVFTGPKELNKGPGRKQSGGINFGVADKIADLINKARSKSVPERTPPNKKSPVSHYFLEETRSPEQFWAEEGKNASTWKDIPTDILNQLLQGRAIANLAKHANPIVRFIVHRTIGFDRESRVNIENALWGKSFGSSLIRGISKRVKGEDGALTYLDKAKFPDADKLRQTLLKFDNAEELHQNGLTRPTDAMLAREGLNPQQIKAANAIYNQISEVYKKVNDMLKAAGKEEINLLPGYIPHMWFGDYRVLVKNEKGESVAIQGVENKFQAAKLKKEFEKQFPKHQVEMFDASQNKYKANDISAFELATRVLSKDSPERQILERVYNQVISHRGFRTHGLQRKGVKGFAGSGEGRKGMRDFEKALEVWFHEGYRFISNEQKRGMYGDTIERLSKMENLPDLTRTKDYINQYTQNATGTLKNQLEFIDNVLEGVGDVSRFGPSAPKKILDSFNGLASFFWLTTGKNFLVNAVQPIMNYPKMLAVKSDLQLQKSVHAAFAKAYTQTFVPGMLKGDSLKALNWAKENGFIDSKTLELIKSRFNKASLAHDFAYNTAKHTLGWWEQEVVRTPAFLMYDNLLKDEIKNPTERWKTAGALTDQYMVDYGKTESPLAFGKMGTTGEAMKRLKQYSVAYHGQLMEYAHLAATEKQFAPLASLLGVQTAISGIKGLPYVASAGVIIQMLNNVGANIATPEEVLLTSGISDTWVWGPLSKVTGLDLSKSLGAPGLEEFVSFPGLSFAAGVGTGAVDMISEAAKGTLAPSDVMQDVAKMVPNPHVQAGLEKVYQLPSGHIPDPANRMLPKYGSPRSEGDMMKRLLTGGQLLKESEERAVINSTRATAAKHSKAKAEIMEKIVEEAVLNKQKPSKELIDDYVKNGGDPRNLKSELKSYLRDSLMGQLERQIVNTSGLNQVDKVKELERYRGILDKLKEEELVELYKEYK